MTKPTKRSLSEAGLGYHIAKRRKPNESMAPVTVTIANARQILALLNDLSTPQNLQKGYQSFRNFLLECVPGHGTVGECKARTEVDVVRNKAVLRDWLESEMRGIGSEMKRMGKFSTKDREYDEQEMAKFSTLVQGLGFASQSSNQYLLSSVASAFALLIRTTSSIPELTTYGAVLCRVFIETANLKLILRGIAAYQDRIASPMLRLLTEINKFNFGEFCSLLFTKFDFTIKDLGRNLEPKKASTIVAPRREDMRKPALRTVYIRFILSFLQYGTTNVKLGILEQRPFMSALFKHIKSDPPTLVHEILETFKSRVINDLTIPRISKTQLFSEWVLRHISTLYTRNEPTNENQGPSNTVAECVHEFLMTLCTKPDTGGVCFSNNGWYPPSVEDIADIKQKGHGQKIFNRTLSEFIVTLKPFADTLQQDLLLTIFTAAPELVAPYFSSNAVFSFEPKLTATWIGYCAFLTSLVKLPLPKGGFGFDEDIPRIAQLTPPPIDVIVESVIPRVCTKYALTKSLTFENVLVRFLGTRFMVAAFQKLGTVVVAMEKVAASFSHETNSNSKWLASKGGLVEEFSKRVPDMASVVSAYNSIPINKTGGGLTREVVAKLLMYYYVLLPDVALGRKFDVNIALERFLDVEDKNLEEAKGMRLLEMEHLLEIASDAGDIKWWGRGTGVHYSSFTTVLKFCIEGKLSSSSSIQVTNVLRAVLGQAQIFQQETTADPFDALLESLATARSFSQVSNNVILTFLDDCLIRCVRTPFKYLDEVAELLISVDSKNRANISLSPLIMALTEQSKFLLASKDISDDIKGEVVMWLARLLENLSLGGENPSIIYHTCQCLADIVEAQESSKAMPLLVCGRNIQAWYLIGNSSGGIYEAVYPSQAQGLTIRSIFPCPRQIQHDTLQKIITKLNAGDLDITAFDVAVVLNALAPVIHADAPVQLTEMEQVMDLLELVVSRVKKYENESLLWKVKKLIGGAGSEILLNTFVHGNCAPWFDKRYLRILSILFDTGYEEVLKPLTDALVCFFSNLNAHHKFLDSDFNRLKFESLIHQYMPTEGLYEMISNILGGGKSLNPEAYGVLASIMNCAAKVSLDVDTLYSLLMIGWSIGSDERLLNALVEYLTQSEDMGVSGSIARKFLELEAPDDDEELMARFARRKPELIGVLSRRTRAARDWVVKYFQQDKQGNIKLGLHAEVVLLMALLENFSVKKQKRYVWRCAIEAETKGILKTALEQRKQGWIVSGVLADDPEMLQLLQRVTCLYPDFCMEDIFYVLLNNQQNNPTPISISCVSSLLRSNTGKEQEFAKNSWLVMLVNHLIRLFSEEGVLTEKSISITREFAELVQDNKVTLSKYVPRGTLNVLLEATVEKIDVEEAVELAASIVNNEDTAALNLAKLLQIVLENSKDLFSTVRGNDETSIHYKLTYLIQRLFTLGKHIHSNVTTLEGILLIYRGTCSIIDKILLNIMASIEEHLAYSCASRITTWSLVADKVGPGFGSGKALISRVKGGLAIVINGKIFQESIAQFAPDGAVMQDSRKINDYTHYLELIETQNLRLRMQYDHSFMLPILAYLLAFQAKTGINELAILESGGVQYTILGLCSEDTAVRRTAMQVLSATVARLEESTYRARNQVNHLVCALLASLEDSPIELKPLPTVVGVFFSHVIQVLIDPGHFIYNKVMDILLHSPLLDVWDIPQMLSTLGHDEYYYKTMNWKLMVLSQGLRSETDLELYRKRRLFEQCLSVYGCPYTGDRTKEKVLDLLWNLAEVKGGGTTAVTRNGVVAWVKAMLAKGDMAIGTKVAWKGVVGRLVETAAQRHVKDWSGGVIVPYLDTIYRA